MNDTRNYKNYGNKVFRARDQNINGKEQVGTRRTRDTTAGN